MLSLINTRILLSLATVALAATIIVGATFAFFSDSETSEDNTFVAGTVDLKVDSECHYFQNGVDQFCPDSMLFGNWTQSDLDPSTAYKFFNFDDIKPGDWGEDTISLHVTDNDAWGQFVIGNISSPGELRENMEFWIWLDEGGTPGFQGQGTDQTEGDNVWQSADEPLLISPGDVDASGETWNIWDGLLLAFGQDGASNGITSDGRMVESVTYYFGLGWCFGDADPGALSAADVCDGSGVSNDAQGDSLTGDISINVVQHRNNPTKLGF